ncbi:hypothetical protein RR48_11475 [Papilio machaon]|uniref:Uncharacterized protein n=1 Tax=Papilio machaon TaxID=76193 RepID=A0A194QTV8_PAPMA|nr:hypothetical protein RR48_11475 [Papilio machaon]
MSSGCEASGVREEIARDYAALQSRLRREFSDRQGKLNATSRPVTTRPVATEEQLSADFRKKLAEWQRLRGGRQPPPVPARQDLSEDFLKKWDEWKHMKETNSVPAWEEEAKPDEVLVQTSTGLFKFQGISRSFTRKLHEWEKSRGIAPEASTSALLRAARQRSKAPAAPLTRTQSDGSVAPPPGARCHGSSLSVNDVDDFDSEYDREHSPEGPEGVECGARGAVLVEVEAEEVCTAAPLVAVSPRHTPQTPIYTYGRPEARLLCETNAALTGTALLQPNGSVVILSDSRTVKSKEHPAKSKSARDQLKIPEKIGRRKVSQQPSIEEDAMFIRKTIEEIERGSSARFKDDITASETEIKDLPSTSKGFTLRTKQDDNPKDIKTKESNEEQRDECKRRDGDKSNGKKKTKSRARLEREQSKPSESDSEPDVDTVTVEIPRRRKRPRRPSERPRSPPTSLHSDSEGEVFVLKLKAPERREKSPEVIVKTTRKIFSPVVRSGESVPRAVIPVDVEDLTGVRPTMDRTNRRTHDNKKKQETEKRKKPELNVRSKSSGDLQEGEDHRPRTRPPLPSSPSSQKKQLPKETAPSIRIMIQRYNKKINEEGNVSGGSSGASSPPWRSPSAERRRPPDMPVGINIRNNPFLEREVKKSASACQLSRHENTSAEKRLTPASCSLEGVLKSQSANALLPEQEHEFPTEDKKNCSQDTIRCAATSTDTVVPITTKPPETPPTPDTHPVLRQLSDTLVPSLSRFVDKTGFFERSLSTMEPPCYGDSGAAAAGLSERAARIRAARERFLASPPPMRKEGTSSANDLRPGDRTSRISCESESAETQGSGTQEQALGRSASTGMVNVERVAWQRVAEGPGRERGGSRFSLARLAARLRRGEQGGGGGAPSGAGAVARLCRQSLLVQLRNKH